MAFWIDIGHGASAKPFRLAFIRIMRAMDPRYSPIEETQLAEWLEFPCSVGGYENDRLYAFGAFPREEDTEHAERMQLVLLARHIAARPSNGSSAAKSGAEFLMLGWPGSSADPETLDAAIDVIIDKGTAWLTEIGLPDGPVRVFRPYQMEYGNVRLLHDRICERAVAVPPRGLKMVRRAAMSDGEFWQLAPTR